MKFSSRNGLDELPLKKIMKFFLFFTVIVIAAVIYFYPSSERIAAVKQWMSTHSGFSETQKQEEGASKNIIDVYAWWLHFFGNLNQSVRSFGNEKYSSSTAAENNQTPVSGKNSAGPKNSAPPGFRGPTGPPRIIGPSANPPNY